MPLSRKINVTKLINEYSSKFEYKNTETAVILAAGHGKRIKSQTSKMLHKIWGKPTVERVFEACKSGLPKLNTIIVTGIKAEDVIQVIGEKKNNLFAFQEEQNGTGHAVQIALKKVNKQKYNGTVYILPGDMGLINNQTMKMFRKEFIKSNADMMVLTGMYEGNPIENSYGRIVRVKEFDENGNSSGNDAGKVIEIIEYKDILSLEFNTPYTRKFNGKNYSFTKQELINNNEFNSGVFAFNFNHLVKQITKIKSDNVQGEIYITDLISLFNKSGLTVGAVSAKQKHVIMGFNNKSVLKEMDAIARRSAYDKLKDIIEIDDPDDFFIADDIMDEITKEDKNGKPLDIKIGKGVYAGHNVIAELEKYYSVNVVTQNVDNLHERAGSSSIEELHGSIVRNFCIDCKTFYNDIKIESEKKVPRCSNCNGLIRPDVIWFGENLRGDAFPNSEKKAKKCDICFVVGTSAIVYPAAYIPLTAKEYGAYIVEINIEPTELTYQADYSIFGKSGEILPQLLMAIKDLNHNSN